METILCYSWIILTLFFTINFGTVSGEVIALFSQPDAQGNALEVNVDKCTVMPRGWNDKASSVKTSGHCFELFDNKHCTGHSVRIDLPPAHGHRITNLADLSFERMTGSIQPCIRAPDITPLDIGYNPYVNQPIPSGNTVTLYELADRAGKSGDVRITAGCKNLPPHLYKNVASVNTRWKCVRLYDDKDCNGDGIQLEPNDPNANNLYYYDFLDKTASVGPCARRRHLM